MALPPPRDRAAATLRWIAAATALILLMWAVGTLILVLFGGVLLAVLLRSLAEWLSRHARLRMAWALGIVYVAFALLLGAGAAYLAPRVAGQFGDVLAQFDSLTHAAREMIGRYEWGQALLTRTAPSDLAPAVSTVVGRLTGIAGGAVAVAGGLAVALFVAVYLSWDPQLYTRGLLWTVPPQRRERARSILSHLYETLRWWLVGRVISMAAVGLLTAAGLWFLGIPLVLTLAVVAALLDFIPYLGPLLAAIPAVAVALSVGPTEALWVAALFLVVQSVEGYLLTPLIQMRTIHLPPALTIAAEVLMGALFGMMGVAMATPLAAVAIVLTRMMWVEDALGDRRVPDPMAPHGDGRPVEP